MILYFNRGILGLLIFWSCNQGNAIFGGCHGSRGNEYILPVKKKFKKNYVHSFVRTKDIVSKVKSIVFVSKATYPNFWEILILF